MDSLIEMRSDRGPSIAGTRINIYDVYYYLENNWSKAETADILGVSLEQVQAAVAYIKEHKADVMAVHQRIEERNARGNPPEIQAKLELAHIKLQDMLKANRERKPMEVEGVGTPGRQ
jgi:uncharacterized protein (DUF433 family)